MEMNEMNNAEQNKKMSKSELMKQRIAELSFIKKSELTAEQKLELAELKKSVAAAKEKALIKNLSENGITTENELKQILKMRDILRENGINTVNELREHFNR